MKIYNYEIEDKLILEYCRVITALEKKYSAELERVRSEIHNNIYESVKLNRACITREDRRFTTALMHVIVDITFKPGWDNQKITCKEVIGNG